jgi:hypothetical protein
MEVTKMRRTWIYMIGAVLVVAAIAGILIARDNSQDHTDKPGPANKSAAADRDTVPPNTKACAIFTLAEAKQVLGSNAKGGASGSNSSSTDLDVSTCSYSQTSGTNAPVSGTKSASLLVRAPKTAAGTTSNQNQFGPLKPADAQAVAGYGDNAYWDPQFGQLDILKNNTWYILSNGPITPSERTPDQAKALADLLINKM